MWSAIANAGGLAGILLLLIVAIIRGWLVTGAEHRRICTFYENALDARERQVRILTNGAGHDVERVVAADVATPAPVLHAAVRPGPSTRRQGRRGQGT